MALNEPRLSKVLDKKTWWNTSLRLYFENKTVIFVCVCMTVCAYMCDHPTPRLLYQ